VDQNSFPWVVADALRAVDPRLKETRELLRAYGSNPKQTLQSIHGSFSRPEFPESEWLNLIKGRAVDLDTVYSAFNTDHIDTRQTSQYGLVEISFRGGPPTKTIRDYGSWSMAYDALAEATRFCFPGRREELGKYRDWIMRQFGAINPSFHGAVIGLDKAIRNRVAQCNDCLLTDDSRFTDLVMSYCNPAGLNYKGYSEPRGSTNPAKTTKSGEICRRYNEGKCPSDARTCRYRHACGVCKLSGHPEDKCS
ncbi:hypothetical protein BD410DRAFT_703684, partial [Rickenella mellea]